MDSAEAQFYGLPVSGDARSIVEGAERELTPVFAQIDRVRLANQAKVLQAFRHHRVEGRHFAGSTGYGYGDIGRDTLDGVFAAAFSAEAALVRPQIVSGTHALSLCLYALAGRGSRVVSATGAPYDTLLETIGLSPGGSGVDSLMDLGVQYSGVPLTPAGAIDIDGVLSALRAGPGEPVVYLQRSRGYDWRPSVCVAEIRRAVEAVRSVCPGAAVVVDNCYGEFTETEEPTDAGADVIVGSLIKNPGGGLAPTGAYIAGKKRLIDRIQYRLTAPGIGAEVGSWPAGYLPFYQGLFLAPHVTGESLKGAALFAASLRALGYDVMPGPFDARSDITQSVRFNSEQKLLAFCRLVQRASPVDGHVVPEPWPMPGYQNDVVMAAGTFIQGASIELSADAPIKPPYIGYIQGGLTYEHCKLAALTVVTGII